MYQVRGFVKMWEEDIYDDGCQPNSGSCYSDRHITWTDDTVAKLLQQLCDFLNVPHSDVILNSCGEPGRVDIQTLENNHGDLATPQEIMAWKDGRRSLWSCIYTFSVEEVQGLDLAIHPGLEDYTCEDLYVSTDV